MNTILNTGTVPASSSDRPVMAALSSSPPVGWEVTDGLTEYEAAVSRMELLASEIAAGKADERVWLVEHPPLYTAGTSAKDDGLLEPDRFPVFQTGRGGEYTYHGPGQRVAYTMLDLKRRKPDVRVFITTLEDWIIATLADFNVRAERRAGRIGVWVERPDKPPMQDGSMREEKIAAIGIRLRRWVSFHGISINVDPHLSHFDGIIPCGIADYGVTSLVDLGIPASMDDVDVALKRNFERYFGDIG